MNVELVAPDRKIWSGEAEMVIARTTDGDIGILPGHEPTLGVPWRVRFASSAPARTNSSPPSTAASYR